MKLDLNKYRRVNKRIVKKWFKEKEKLDQWLNEVPKISVASNCPIVAVYHYFGEIYGFTPRLEEAINDLIKFYGYTVIIGKMDHCGDCNTKEEACQSCVEPEKPQ